MTRTNPTHATEMALEKTAIRPFQVGFPAGIADGRFARCVQDVAVRLRGHG